jgi:phosphatidyl-myo-inositol dimannoside synthase
VSRALFIAERFPPDLGGLARSSHRTAMSLSKLGVDVQVIAWTKSLPPGSLETQEPSSTQGYTLHRLGLFSNWDLSLQHSLNVLNTFHREQAYDWVWGHYLFPAGFFAVMFAQSHQLPCAVSARGNDVDQMMFPPGDFGRLMWTLQRADHVTAVSKDLSTKIQVLLGTDKPVSVIPNAVDAELFKPTEKSQALKTALGIGEDELVLGFSGELKHKKGFPFLLSALAEVHAQRPCVLLVIGEVRARTEEHFIAFRTRHPEAAERIIITGHLEHGQTIVDHLALCDVFLAPSVWDGLPNAVLEAMAMEKLVIASQAGGLPEAITHRENGLLIPVAQLHRLSEAIFELEEQSDEVRRKIQTEARRTILAHHQSENELAALQTVIDALPLKTP